MWIYSLICIVIAYLIGSVPFGLLIARTKGINIRTVGSGNIGATNVFRAVSKPLGILTFFCDFLKGFIPGFLLPRLLARLTGFEDPQQLLALGCGMAAIAGHNWSIFLGFKGGKGVATSTGVLIGITPAAVGIGLLCWIGLLLATGYVSVASIGAAAAVAGAGWFFQLHFGCYSLPTVAVLTLLAALIIARHHANIKRLLNHTENKFTFGKK